MLRDQFYYDSNVKVEKLKKATLNLLRKKMRI